jgi:hypothetical protein
MHDYFLHMLPTFGATKSKPNKYLKINHIAKKKSFSFKPFHNGFCSFQNSCIVYYLIKCIIRTLPNLDVCSIDLWNKLKSIALFNAFLLIPWKWKCSYNKYSYYFKWFKTTYIVSNLLLDFLIILTWYHFTYNHTPIHYSRELINVIKTQNSHLQSFFVRLSFFGTLTMNVPFKNPLMLPSIFNHFLM